MGVMNLKPARIVELLEDKLGKLLKDIIYIFKIDHQYMVHRREEQIASFKIKAMPGQCGIAVLYNLNVDINYRKKGIGKILLNKALKIAKEQDYTSCLVSIKKSNELMTKMLEEEKFNLLYQFRNNRTKNAVLIWQKDIKKHK